MKRLLTTWFLLAIAATTASVLRETEGYHYPRYVYKYSVNDPKTRDIKDHWEARDGDLVKGAYSLVEPDGNLRLVDYWADDAHGFNADVKRFEAYTQEDNVLPPEITPEEPKVAPPTQTEPEAPVTPTSYGFGSSGNKPPLGGPNTSVRGTGSLLWDSRTGSYGGWVPLQQNSTIQATIFNKKYIDGKLQRWRIGPISLDGRKLVVKIKH